MYVEMGGNLVPVTKSGDQLRLTFHSFRDNRVSFVVRVRDALSEDTAGGRLVLMQDPKSVRAMSAGIPSAPLCTLNITLPDVVPGICDDTTTSDSRSEYSEHDTRYTDTSAVTGSTRFEYFIIYPCIEVVLFRCSFFGCY